MDNVTSISEKVQVKRSQTGELAKRIYDLIMEYEGEIGIAEAVGALECVKFNLLTEAKEEITG